MKLATTALVGEQKVKLETTAYLEKPNMKSKRSDYNYSEYGI